MDRRGFVIAGIAASALLLVGCGPSAEEKAAASASRAAAVQAALEAMGPKDVVYEVEGTAAYVDITLSTPSGTRQQSGVGLPLTNKTGSEGLVVKMAPGEFAYISAQNGTDTGTVTCRITAGETVIAENSSSGSYVIASCSGRVP